MAVLLQQVDRRTKLGVLLLDVLISEEVSFESQVTMYPVEDGTEISDHITEGSKRIRLSGMIATADASGGWGFLAGLGVGAEYRANNPQEAKLIDVIEALERMHKSREVVTISTGQMVYENMAFTNMTASRASQGGTGNWLNINAELVRVRKVKLKTADVPPPENVSNANGAAGRSGETNKPAGRNAAGGAGTNRTPPASDNARRSVLKMVVPEKENTISSLIQRGLSAGGGV